MIFTKRCQTHFYYHVATTCTRGLVLLVLYIGNYGSFEANRRRFAPMSMVIFNDFNNKLSRWSDSIEKNCGF